MLFTLEYGSIIEGMKIIVFRSDRNELALHEKYYDQHRIYSYLDRGIYSKQLRRLWNYFPKEQILILKSEDLRHTPNEVLKRICTFLKISHFPLIESKDVHCGSYSSRMENREREFLTSFFKKEVKSLESILGWDCSDWLSCSKVGVEKLPHIVLR